MLLRPVPANLYLEPPVLVPDRYEVGFAGGMRAPTFGIHASNLVLLSAAKSRPNLQIPGCSHRKLDIQDCRTALAVDHDRLRKLLGESAPQDFSGNPPKYALQAQAAPLISRRAWPLPKCSVMKVAKLSAASSSCPNIGTLKISNAACPTSWKVTQKNCPTAAWGESSRSNFAWQQFHYAF
jgi:hypothetical protein